MTRPLREIEPTKTSSLKLYSSSTIECLERLEGGDEVSLSTRISGKSSRCGKWSWLVRGSALEVIDPVTAQRLSAWRFGWSTSKKLAFSINCVEEFSSPNGLYLLVGLQSMTSSSGMLCLFDPLLSRVIKAIEFPRAVTTIECVTSSGGATSPQHSISAQLRLMFGAVAVGMTCGHVYLVDLRLDDDVEEFDEWNPSHLDVVDADNTNIAALRTRAREDGAHIAFELGGECHMLGSFSYASPEGEILGNYSSSEISITSLKYIRQLGSLVVGYSFGCFQVWDLEHHSREFSSSFGVYLLPVTHIIYQEPENDPRLCCYLWVARGQSDQEETRHESPTTITLYQLIFDRKENLFGYGRVLKDFSGCGGRFEHQLTGDPYHLADATTCGSRVLCFYTLERDEAAIDVIRMDDSSEEAVSRDLTLAVCVWEAPPVELHTSPSCHMAVFDINRWYHSQMPANIRDAMYGSKDPTCPFFSVYSLADVLDTANPDALVDVLVHPNEICRFSTTYGALPEQFYWASSLTFDCICLMETGIVRANFYGTQQQVLNDLSRKGVTALNEAHEYFQRCWTASLMPKNFDFSRAQEKTFQVEGLLSVALEHNKVSFILSCIHELGGDNVTYAGCSLRIILEWAWDQVIQIKQHLDKLCIPLYDGTGIFVDKQLIAILDHYNVQLDNLIDIFQALSSAAPTTEQGLKELESQHTVCFLLNQYLQVVLFFMKQRLLPELFDNDENGELSSQYYPGEVLAQQYEVRRRNLQQINRDSLGSLMIDRIISTFTNNMNSNLWDTGNRWAELYPPPNLHALCSLVLQEKINPTSKLCIIYYALLDLCSLNPQFRTKKVAEKFAATFGIQPVLAKLFHGFWCLDHKDFDNALKLLVDSTDQLTLAPWQNSHIIRLFLEQGEIKKALLFIRSVKPAMSSPADVELRLSVLIKNGLVTEAFQFQRQCRDPMKRRELLEHFFFGCYQAKNTNQILKLPLNKVETEHLIRFLEQSPFPHARELLVMFYLQRGSYVDAIRVNELLKQDTMSEHDPAAQRRAAVRNVILGKYFDLLPKVQQDLAMRRDTAVRQKATKHTEVPRPKPLTTVVRHKVNARVMSQTAVINATLEKIAEARTSESKSPQETPFTGTPSTKKKKSLLSDCHSISFPKFPSEDITAAATEPKVLSTHVSQQQSMTISPMSTWLRKDRARKVFKGANALSLLQTPPITKHLSFAATPSVSSRPTVTPHSILKPTRITRRSPSPSIISPSLPPRIRRVSSDRVPWMETESDNEESGLASQKKQIRFKSPSPSSPGPEDSFTFETSRSNPFTKTAVARIPEEDDRMESETGSGAENSSDSVSESENETEMRPSTSGKQGKEDKTAHESGDLETKKDNDVTVIAMFDLENDDDDKNDVKEGSLAEIPAEFPQRIDSALKEDESEPADEESTDVQVVAVLDFDEDDEDIVHNVATEEGEPIEPETKEETFVVENPDVEVEATTPNDSGSHVIIDTPLTSADEEPAESVPTAEHVQLPSPKTCVSLSKPSTSPEAPPERSFMPIRDTTPVVSFHSPAIEPQAPEALPSAISSSNDLHRTSLDSKEPDGENDSPRNLSPSLASTPGSSHEILGFRPEVCTESLKAKSGEQTAESTRLTTESPRPTAEGTPISGRTTSVSTMTPPMSPPKTPGLVPSVSGSNISPRIYLDDISSPHPAGNQTPVVSPSQSERRRSRSPHRSTPNRTEPPLTRSAQRRRSARLVTPHQSPTDSPISFVTPVRKTSPRRKSPSQKKPVKLASHNMTLRARSCPNKTTRRARLPNTT